MTDKNLSLRQHIKSYLSEALPKKLKETLIKKSVVSVFILVILWNISVATNLIDPILKGKGAIRETAREIQAVNLHLQLRFYQALTKLRPISIQPTDVRLVFIDDETHWGFLQGTLPTNRSFLASLITNASQPATKAAAIGLDVELFAPQNYPEGTDSADRSTQNDDLRKAIKGAAERGVPVILATAYYTDAKGQNFRIPGIYKDDALRFPGELDCQEARCPTIGYINAPVDKRQIPLTKELTDTARAHPIPTPSFALALAKAVRGSDLTENDPILSDMESHEDVIYGSFLGEDRYKPVSAIMLANNDQPALKACANRIVLIGGHWHNLQGYGDLVDSHLSPAGYMSGLGFHANYVQSLLQRQFAHEVPLIVGSIIDIIVGLIIYICFESLKGQKTVLVVLLLAFIFPISCAYIFLVTANLYLDFLLPAELYFIHIAYELIKGYVELKWRHTPAAENALPPPAERVER